MYISPARWINFALRVLKKHVRNLSFLSCPCKHPPDCPSISFHLAASVPKCFRQSWPRPNMVRACNRRERVRHMSTTATSSVGPVLYSSRTLSHPLHPPLLTIREHVQRVNYVTHLAGSLWHPTPKFNFWSLIFANFIFQMCHPSKGSWMAHLKIRNPSKGGVSAACLKTI